MTAPFIGDRPAGFECCHWDGDKLNNHLANLRGDSRAGNVADKVRHGRAGGRAKLSADGVRAVRSSQLGTSALARAYGVRPNAIRRARDRETWKHVE